MKTQRTIQDVQLSYQRTDRPIIKITSSKDAADACFPIIPAGQIGHHEFFGMLLLNRGNRVLRQCILSQGGIHGTVVDKRHVMQCAILSNAVSIILFHNHPSGELKPSEPDISLTRGIKEACRFFEINLLDHIILSGYPESLPNYYSFADEGML